MSEIQPIIELSRLQFALTALYHFLFVPLTLGLSLLLGIMETVYVITNNIVWRDMVKFWGLLFGINFALGVATGLTMEFQFGTNWAYYSQYVGDVFGVPLAIEGLMAFFLEATFVGVFFLGWEKLSKRQHLISTWALALGTNFSALWILIANGWMQNPVGAEFNFHTMRMEVSNFADILFNPIAQSKFVHTISAGYVTGSVFMLSISAYYLLRRRNIDFAIRSMAVALTFGLASALTVIVLGDESGYEASVNQKMKVAGLEAMWKTEPAPASLTIFGIPDNKTQEVRYAIKIPFILGLIATRSLTEEVKGIDDLAKEDKEKIKEGIIAYGALKALQKDPNNKDAQETLAKHQSALGYGLLLKKYTQKITNASEDQINAAVSDLKPDVFVLFFAFRIMVAIGFGLIVLFAAGFYLFLKQRLKEATWFHRLALYALPFPWIAAELGWVIAEYGRQPWAIQGILPTFLGASSVNSAQLLTSLTAFVVFYSVLAVIEVFLMIKYIRLGPENAN